MPIECTELTHPKFRCECACCAGQRDAAPPSTKDYIGAIDQYCEATAGRGLDYYAFSYGQLKVALAVILAAPDRDAACASFLDRMNKGE